MRRTLDWTAEEARPLQRALLVFAGVFVVIAVLLLATRIVRDVRGTHDLAVDLVLGYGVPVATSAAALLVIATSVITWKARKP